jgi:hypothetical protein
VYEVGLVVGGAEDSFERRLKIGEEVDQSLGGEIYVGSRMMMSRRERDKRMNPTTISSKQKDFGGR